jgi:hypothetical protein
MFIVRLVGGDDMDGYTSKPIHMLFPFALFVVGAWLIASGSWLPWAGAAAWLVGFFVGAWIVIAGFWDAKSRYYDSAARAIEAAKGTDIAKLAALGFTDSDVPRSIHVDMHEGTRSRHYDLPVSPVKLAPLAAALVNGQPFTERRWAGDGGLFSCDEFRTLRGVMRDRGLIEPINDKDNRQGFKLTAAGHEVMSELLPSPTA